MTRHVIPSTRNAKGCHLAFKGLHGNVHCALKYTDFQTSVCPCYGGGTEEVEVTPRPICEGGSGLGSRAAAHWGQESRVRSSHCSQLCAQLCPVQALRAAVVGVFTPQKLVSPTNQGFVVSRKPVVNLLSATPQAG